MNRLHFLVLVLIAPFLSYAQSPTKLMGISSKGGTNNAGTIYSVNADGSDFQLHHDFGEVGPHRLNGRLTLGSDDFLYGVSHGGGAGFAGTIFRMTLDGSDFDVIHSFEEANGLQPYAPPIEGADGALYGATAIGGNLNLGVIYKVNKDGSNFQSLHHFSGTDGELPLGKLLLANDGLLYGLTNKGGQYNEGAMYRIETDGSNFESLHSFNGLSEGRFPYGGFIEDDQGLLYATLSSGGANQGGVVFSIQKDGSALTALRSFDFSIDNGNSPYCTLLEGSDDKLYGTTYSGGNDYIGTVFSLAKDGSDYSLLYEFSSASGRNPFWGDELVEDDAGFIYSSTIRGGTSDMGVVYRLSKDGSNFEVLHTFDSLGINPYAGVVWANGALIGTTSEGGTSNGGTLYKLDSDGNNFQLLQDLSKTNIDGYFPVARPVEAIDQYLYGTTTEGGAFGFGVLFRQHTTDGNFEVLHHFDLETGNRPSGALIQSMDGQLYGSATNGGEFGNGTLFRFNPANTNFEVIHHFSNIGEYGAAPNGALLEASNGMLYGVAQSGGTYGAGSIYQINRDGSSMTAIHHFKNDNTTGKTPPFQLFENNSGQLFGLTIFGGSDNPGEDGTLFRVDLDGNNFEVLKVFNRLENGTPSGPLVSNEDGFLYGTTTSGGDNLVGTIYRISMDGQLFETIHNFDVVNGISPQGALVPSPGDDDLYGIARSGGDTDDGLLFKIAPDGSSFSSLYHFEGATESGAWPDGGLIWLTPVSAQQEMLLLDDVLISPNPGNAPLKISSNTLSNSDKIKLMVADKKGAILLSLSGDLLEINQQLGLNSLQWFAGTYFVRIEAADGFYTEKIIRY